MKSDNSAVVYNAESTAAGLNRVKGFDPLKYVRSTENGAVLDLPYQKLWFRLRHPNGKIRIFIKNLAVYFRQSLCRKSRGKGGYQESRKA